MTREGIACMAVMLSSVCACSSDVLVWDPITEPPANDAGMDACPSAWSLVGPSQFETVQWAGADEAYVIGNGHGLVPGDEPIPGETDGFIIKIDECGSVQWQKRVPSHLFESSESDVTEERGLAFVRSDDHPFDFGAGPMGGIGLVTYGLFDAAGAPVALADEPGQPPLAVDAGQAGVVLAFQCADGSAVPECAQGRAVVRALTRGGEPLWQHVVGLATVTDPGRMFLGHIEVTVDGGGGVTVVGVASTGSWLIDGEVVAAGTTFLVRFRPDGELESAKAFDTYMDSIQMVSDADAVWLGGLGFNLDLGAPPIVHNRFVARLTPALEADVVVPFLTARGYPDNVDLRGLELGQELLIHGSTYGQGARIGDLVLHESNDIEHFVALLDRNGAGLGIVPIAATRHITRRADGSFLAVGELNASETVEFPGLSITNDAARGGSFVGRFSWR